MIHPVSRRGPPLRRKRPGRSIEGREAFRLAPPGEKRGLLPGIRLQINRFRLEGLFPLGGEKRRAPTLSRC